MHLILYDGECGMCSRLVRAVLTRDPAGIFEFASLQSRLGSRQLARFGGDVGRLDTVVVIPRFREQTTALLIKSSATLFVLSALGWPWRIAGIFRVLPRTLLDQLYDYVARHRRRVAPSDPCALLRPEHRARFLDGPENGGPPAA
jgi:predicted DCC family thiol-disulfide oxidoreductase YuxK